MKTFLAWTQEVGARLWPSTYGRKPRCSDGEALSVALADASPFGLDGDAMLDATESVASALWVDGGCRMIEGVDTYFAAMAKTSVHADAATDLHVPWPSFVVKLPRGLFTDRDGYEFTTARFAQFTGFGEAYGHEAHETSTHYVIHGDLDGPSINGHRSQSLSEFLFSSDVAEPYDGAPALTNPEHSMLTLIKRATAGLLFTMQHTSNWKFGGAFSKVGNGRSLRSEPPPHRTIIIGKALSLDVREQVRHEARTGKRSSPAVQTLVRGHIKRQVVGLSGTGRKVIWIEPYWRGPESAPILARPYRVGRQA